MTIAALWIVLFCIALCALGLVIENLPTKTLDSIDQWLFGSDD